ncbi:DDE superfamily endonuclease, partial [Rhizoctonia solani 123E]
AKHPSVVSAIKTRLVRYRRSGSPLEMVTIRGFMIATISTLAPELFDIRLRKDKSFRCSDQFVRNFLHNELNWSLRRPTQAAQKVPKNAPVVLKQAFLRMACAIRDENIPSCCIVNSDQTQVVYSHGSQYTWCETGAKQVAVVGKEEKRAYTLLIGVSNSGQLLPFQAIYQGSTAASLPHPSSSGYGHAIKLGTRIEFSMTKTYWSTLQTMEDYVTFILVPFMKRMISENNLPPDQRCIWQIDVWSVHRSAAFRNWISETYPWIILQYIPGGCTGIFQACDVALQRVAKAAMRQKALADVINETNALLSDGADPTTVVHDKSIKTLRDRSVSWMLEAHRALDNPQLIQKAFSLCAVPDTEFNLSYSSLTSHEARQAIQALRTSDPKFHAEITAGRPASLTEDDENNEEDGNNEGDEDAEEDSDEALSAAEVVQM